jgi:glycosyltransferase involved in cell wall biosynthesis
MEDCAILKILMSGGDPVKITIGVTTFNRPEYLEKMSASLYASHGLQNCNIRVYDDYSPAWDLHYLQQQFPTAAEIVIRNKNLGADYNMRQMYLDFLATNDDYLIAADSDLIFHPDWIDFITEHIAHTDGIMSLYNSSNHPAVETCTIHNNPFLKKEHIGSAGTVMSRAIVAEIVENLPFQHSFDWAWSAYLRETGRRLLVSRQSYIQHISLYGQNCNSAATIDFALNFLPGNEANQAWVIEFFQQALLEVHKNLTRAVETKADEIRQTPVYRIGSVVYYPIKRIIPLKNSILKRIRRFQIK